MRLFRHRKDDFAEIAADPVRPTMAITDIGRRVRRFSTYAALMGFVSLLLGWDGRVLGSVSGVFLGALFLAEAAALRSDLHMLQMLDHESKSGTPTPPEALYPDYAKKI